jgi:GT2 family glycosyltransferase/glycosyltransferase involved in cell wall biosynthesis
VIRVRASLIISSWNGRHLLERCLPSALRAVAHAGGDHEVIVVDDGSTDDTVEYVQREFPEVRVVALPRNLRFAGANNAGARVARGDVLVFLNNDMQVSPGFLAPLLKHFEHPAVFAATARLQMKPRRVAGGYIEETGLVRARFEDGFFVLQHDQPITEEPVQVLYAGGGSSAVRRDRFFELGGFDRLFRPFYFEDLDISYRAQKHGWQVVYEPKSMMVHAHRQTNSPENFPGGYVDRMFGKNSLLFTWKVLTDRDLLGQHFRALWLSLMRPRAHPAMGAFFFRALAQLPGLLRARHRARRGLVLSDREAIARAAAPAQDEATEAGRIPYGSSGRGKHVLVIGFAPLPFEKERRLGALTFRTWHVTQALLAAGHEVTLVAVRMAAAYEEENRRPRALRFRGNHFTYYSVEHAVFDDGRFVQRVCNRIQPEALVTVHSYPTWAASRLDCDAPLWADLNGYGMSEAQARAAVAGDDAAVADAWRWERATLARADVFSVVSGRQKFALIGELAAVGRLKGSNYGNDSVYYLPNAVEPEPYRHTRRVLREWLVEEGDFVVLWAGGYNTWTDVETLFEGLAGAMRENERIRFVSLGGAMPGRDETTFYRFRQMVEDSELSDRFIFTGWVPNEDVPNYYFESDVGINIDRYSYEMLIGCRYRILDMLRAGLPVVTTLGTEISHLVEQERLGATFAPGDVQGLTDALLDLARDATRRRRSADRARDWVVKNRRVSDVMKPLVRWVASPARSPDRLTRPQLEAAGWQPQRLVGRLGQALETRGLRGGVGELTRAAASVASEALSKLFMRRQPTLPWGLDSREPPHSTLVIRAAGVGLARRAAERIRSQYPSAEIVVLAPEALAEQTRYETGLPVLAAAGVEACGYRVHTGLIGLLRERRFDTVVVAGEGNRRAELLALVSGADRRVEVREDGAAHTFRFFLLKPVGLGVKLLVSMVEMATLSALVALAWGSVAAEGCVWAVRRRWAAEKKL